MNTRYAVALIVGFLGAHGARATTYLWSSNNATYGLLAGSATFTTAPDPITSDCGASSCYELQIVVSNTSTNPVNQSSQILEGIFFDVLASNGSELNNAVGMLSAVATGGQLTAAGHSPTNVGADVCGAGTPTQGSTLGPKCTTVAKGWEAAYSTSGFTLATSTHYSQNFGIGDAGWGLYNGNDVGNPKNGIVPGSGVGTASSPNGSVKFPLVYGTATFTLYGLKTDQVSITNLIAAYGTSPEAVVFSGANVPEPSTVALVAGALVLLLARKRRRS